MKQLFTNYSISGSTITLTGLNVPLNQLLCIEDNTNGKELYATGTVAPTSYTQGTNSVIVTSVAPSSNSDKLTIYYDDAVVSNINTSTLALESGGNLATIATNTGKIPSKGTATIANSTPVNIASDQTVPVSGTVTANTGLSQPLTDAQLRATAVPVSGTFYQATQPVSVASLPSLASGTNAIGTVNPDISPATGSLSSGSNTYTVTTTNYSTLTFQAVKSGTISSGTVTIYGSVDGTTFSVLTTYVSLTTGGSSTTFSATNAITAGQINTSGLKSVQFSGGSTIVGGGSLAFTVNQSASVSNVMLDNALPVGSNTIGTVGLNAGTNAIGSITNTAFTANAGTNLNTSALALESGGNLATVATKMSDGTQATKIVNGANTLSVDSSGALTANNAAAQVYNYTATGAVSSATVLIGAIDCSQFREINVHCTAIGTGMTFQGQISNDNSTWATTAQISNAGSVSAGATISGTAFVSFATLGARYFRVVSTVAQTAGTTTIVAYASQQATPKLYQTVTVTGTPPITSYPTPATAIGFATYHTLISAASTNATSVKNSFGTIGTLILTNSSATWAYFKLVNKASAPTVGTDTAVINIGVAPNTTLDCSTAFAGLRMSTGIAYYVSGGTSLTDNTALLAANTFLVNMTYV
jgi:hypothetical protein